MKRDCACPRASHEHGTTAAYVTCGCRCLPCRLVYDAKVSDRRAGIPWAPTDGRIPRIGTIRRIQALHAMGWSGGQLAERLGITFQGVHGLRSGELIYPGTAARVAALYDELWNKPPTGRDVTKTARWAARKGWVPPLAWDDDEIDSPDAKPCTPKRNPVERMPCGTHAAARRHYRRGEPLDAACLAANQHQKNNRKAAA